MVISFCTSSTRPDPLSLLAPGVLRLETEHLPCLGDAQQSLVALELAVRLLHHARVPLDGREELLGELLGWLVEDGVGVGNDKDVVAGEVLFNRTADSLGAIASVLWGGVLSATNGRGVIPSSSRCSQTHSTCGPRNSSGTPRC